MAELQRIPLDEVGTALYTIAKTSDPGWHGAALEAAGAVPAGPLAGVLR